MSPFADIAAESLGPWCSQFANFIEGMIESTIQMLSVEVQVDMLNQRDKSCDSVDLWCEVGVEARTTSQRS